MILFTGASQQTIKIQVIGEIVSNLVTAVQQGKQVDLNKLKNRISSQYGLATAPRLVDIIAAVSDEHKTTLLPILKAKPVRTASGVSVVPSLTYLLIMMILLL